MQPALSVEEKLSHWLTVRCLGKRPKTQEFYRDVHKIFLREWPALSVRTADASADVVLEFSRRVTECCPSRWNAMVAALKFVLPQHAGLLKRRRIRRREFVPPNQLQFEAFLAECDVARKSQAGLVARFLAHTGLRITEARALTWERVSEIGIDVPGHVTKNQQPRTVPHLPGTLEILERLRAVDSGGHVLPRSSPRKAIESASRKVFGVRWSFHCFRHLYATRCVEQGVDLPTLARWLGHSDGGALLAKTYFHLVDAHSRAMAAKVMISAKPPKTDALGLDLSDVSHPARCLDPRLLGASHGWQMVVSVA